MAATVTLGMLSFPAAVGVSDSQVKVDDTSGLVPGTRLYVDRELMSVTSLDVSNLVNVRRGVDGTFATAHTAGNFAYFGAPDQFFSYDPQGKPLPAVLVSPHINVRTGDVWFAQGNPGGQDRWWQKQAITFGVGALGIPVPTASPTSST